MILDEEVVESLLRSIDGDLAPVGPDGRDTDDDDLSDRFRELKSERKAIVKAELSAHTAEDDVPPDFSGRWADLAEQAISYVAERSKDLEVMTMLVEASVRTDGLTGFGAAIGLLRAFVETYWDQGMYPPEDEEDKAAARFNPLSGLSGGGERDGAIILPLRRMPLIGSLSYSSKILADAKFNSAQAIQDEEAKASMQRAGEDALEELRTLAQGVSAATVRATIDLLQAAETDWRATINFIADRTKPLLPSASSLSRDLEGMREWLTALFAPQLSDGTAESGGSEANSVAAGPTTVAGGSAAAPGAIADRDGALRTVLAIAAFFDKTEPLSPIGPALRDVARRANLSFDALMAELLPESGSREGFYLRSGIRPPPDEE